MLCQGDIVHLPPEDGFVVIHVIHSNAYEAGGRERGFSEVLGHHSQLHRLLDLSV
jgi:hypothetical protein